MHCISVIFERKYKVIWLAGENVGLCGDLTVSVEVPENF